MIFNNWMDPFGNFMSFVRADSEIGDRNDFEKFKPLILYHNQNQLILLQMLM